MKTPKVDEDADAEALLWEVWVADDLQGDRDPIAVMSHYIRIKIFTDRGRETRSTINIEYFGGVRIGDIAGRTIKPDGTVIPLKKDAIFERTLVKVGGLKVKAMSFAMPGVEPGSIIEYRYREFHDNLSWHLRLPLQRDIPVQLVRYHIKPFSASWMPYGMRSINFNSKIAPFETDRDGFSSTSASNVPAFVEEPNMPPEDEVRPWILVFYAKDNKLTADKYWKDFGREEFKVFKDSTKVNGNVRKTADEIVSGAANDDEKLRRIFDYCRGKIKNVGRDNVTAQERADAKKNKTPADTINQGLGSGFDIDMAFAALATAAGFDSRVTRLADRSDKFFNPNFADSYFLSGYNVAVNVDGKWRFYDPASTYVPFGMLRWQEEGEKALISDNKEPEFVDTPLTGPEKSVSKRRATFELSEDGTLEGDVQLEYFGHPGIARKSAIERDSEEQRKENVREMIKNQMSTAELTEIHVDNALDPEKPLIYRYHVKVPGYATRTGKRLFVKLEFFEFNSTPRFTSATRKHDIYFHYPWSEEDSVIVKFPDGYELDHADAPGSFGLGQVGAYNVKVQVSKDHRLIYTRKLVFGANGATYFPAQAYAQLKNAFEAIHNSDMHEITLKQQVAATQ